MLLVKADADIRVAELLLSPQGNPTNDENIIDLAAFHVQQAIEKTLKHILQTEAGISEDYKGYKTHDLVSLITMIENKTEFVVPNDLKSMASNISSWESSSRYGGSYKGTLNEIRQAIDLYKELKGEVETKSNDFIDKEHFTDLDLEYENNDNDEDIDDGWGFDSVD